MPRQEISSSVPEKGDFTLAELDRKLVLPGMLSTHANARYNQALRTMAKIAGREAKPQGWTAPSEWKQFVYVVIADEVMRIKVGTTKRNPVRRLSGMITDSPCKLRLLYLVRVEHGHASEDDLQSLLCEFRYHGEWFDYGDSVRTILHWWRRKLASEDIDSSYEHASADNLNTVLTNLRYTVCDSQLRSCTARAIRWLDDNFVCGECYSFGRKFAEMTASRYRQGLPS